MLRIIKDGFEFVPMFYPFYEKKAILVRFDGRTLEDYQKYILEHGIEKAHIIMPDLKILKLCPSLKYLKIFPSRNVPENFDVSPLYDLPEVKALHCLNKYTFQGKERISEIDFSLINGLIDLSVYVNKGTLNFNKVKTIKSLSAGRFKGENCDLTDLFCSQELDTLTLGECQITSLNGIGTSPKMQCLYLDYNRTLSDISALSTVKKSLRALRIVNCPKIQDFSVLGELENLELLELTGSNTIPSLDFVKSMKNLKTFLFDMNVRDGDLTPCLDLSYVYSVKNRKHYNVKDKQFHKGLYVRGNEDIEEWRRLE